MKQPAASVMAVVTSAVPVHCRAALTHLGLLPYFERIFFAQELGTEKKYPALWEKVAAALGVSPADCTLFDDSVEAIPRRQGRRDAHRGRGRPLLCLHR